MPSLPFAPVDAPLASAHPLSQRHTEPGACTNGEVTGGHLNGAGGHAAKEVDVTSLKSKINGTKATNGAGKENNTNGNRHGSNGKGSVGYLGLGAIHQDKALICICLDVFVIV